MRRKRSLPKGKLHIPVSVNLSMYTTYADHSLYQTHVSNYIVEFDLLNHLKPTTVEWGARQ